MNHNEPMAFPLGYSHGMTLRDYFAAKAMQAYLTHHFVVEKMTLEMISESAFEMADAMIEQRKKTVLGGD